MLSVHFATWEQDLAVCTISAFCQVARTLPFVLFYLKQVSVLDMHVSSQTARGSCNLRFLHFLSVGTTLLSGKTKSYLCSRQEGLFKQAKGSTINHLVGGHGANFIKKNYWKHSTHSETDRKAIYGTKS